MVEKSKKDNIQDEASGKPFEALKLQKLNTKRLSLNLKNHPIFQMFNTENIDDSTRVVRGVFWLMVVLLVGFGGGWLGSTVHDNRSSLSTAQTKEIVSNQNQLTAAIASDVEPSVVSIDATAQTTTPNLFGFAQPTQETSQGTGIIISSSGYILTNRHVIPQGTTSVSVVLNDGTTINNVQVVGETAQSDPLDIAILKINNPPEPLQPALLGDSSKVQIGDSVVAIGNALGEFQNTVTNGIISGLGRSIQAGGPTSINSEELQNLFQTNAAINEGNSGGPLVNINGQVIGINTAVAQNAQGIGFAIPINDAMGIIKGVLANNKFERPYLGVYYEMINPSVQSQFNLSQSSGAYIPQNNNGQSSVISGSPAANAGLKPGDIITEVNGVKVNNNDTLSTLIDQNPVGTRLNLTVVRDGSVHVLTVTVGQEPSSVYG